MKKILVHIIIVLTVGLSSINAQTNISAGIVSGTWNKSGSPYKVNGNIVIPDGQTLTIEAGVKIEFAQFKWLRVDGRIIANGKSGSSDSIWFTKQNPHDTGWWRGVKFLSTGSSNDTSRFSYCVFRNAKGIYDTTDYMMCGAMFIKNWAKTNISHSTFYNNEGVNGACINVNRGAFASIKTSTFKDNKVSSIYLKTGPSSGVTYIPIGSAICVRYNGRAMVDSSLFKNNKIGRIYGSTGTIFIGDASTIEVTGYLSTPVLNISNSYFDNNEGLSIRVKSQGNVNANSCVFRNHGVRAYTCLFIESNAIVKSRNCIYENNACKGLIYNSEGDYRSYNDVIRNNFKYSYLVVNDINFKGYNQFDKLKVYNNCFDTSDINATGVFMASMIRNSMFVNNTSKILIHPKLLYNNTIANNKLSDCSIYIDGQTAVLRNNIIRENTSKFQNRHIYITKSINAFFYNNNVSNDTGCYLLIGNETTKPYVFQGNFDMDPLFKYPSSGKGHMFNASNADFGLYIGCDKVSPCINAGYSDTSQINSGGYDIYGNKRFYDGKVDIGAYEDNTGPAIPSITLQPLDDELCLGSRSSILQTKASGLGLSLKWQSELGGTWTEMPGRTSDTLHLISPLLSDNYKRYRLIASGSCGSDTSEEVKVTVNLPPYFTLGNDTALCKGMSLTLGSNLLGSYMWQNGSTTKDIIYNVVKDSICWLQVTDSNNCMSRDSIQISKLDNPIVQLGADFNLHRLKSVILDAGEHQTYLWDNASASRTRTFFGQDLGQDGYHQIWVRVEDENGCKASDTVGISVINLTNLDFANNGDIIQASMFSDKLIINGKINGLLILYDYSGKTILTTDVNEDHVIFDTSFLPAGMYILVYMDERNVQHKIRLTKVN